MTLFRFPRSGVFLLAGSVMTTVALGAVPAQAAAAPAHASAKVPCQVHDRVHVPGVHKFNDTRPVTKSDLNAVRQTDRVAQQVRPGVTGRPVAPRRSPGFRGPVTVPVYVHVIRGTKKGEHTPEGRRRVRHIISHLNAGFHGMQAPKTIRAAHVAKFDFRLRHVDYTKSEGWYHAWGYGPRDRRMLRHLHRGTKRALNIYINGGGPKGTPMLGWSQFPWKQKHHPRLDSVHVNWKAMPGGPLKRYNTGDTLVHETGHWLGLFHTFQGGCGGNGDQIADTPSEAGPSYACQLRRDSCPAKPGLDPVRNFMDYSYDSCMDNFTRDQISRMELAWVRYRK